MLVWSAATIAVILIAFSLSGGYVGYLFQPLQFLIVVAMVAGVSGASGRLMAWGVIFRDLRRTGRATSTVGETRRLALATIAEARTAAMVGGLLASLLGIMHLCGSVTEPPEVVGHLFHHALVGILVGLVVAYGVLAPMGARLADIYARNLVEAPASAPAASASSRGRQTAWIAAAVLAASTAALVAMVGFGSKPANEGPSYFSLPELSVNLDEDGGRRVLTTRMMLEVADPTDGARIDSQMPRIVNAVLIYLSDLHVKDLQGAEAMNRRREELRDRINSIIQPTKVGGILISEMLVQ